MTATVEVGNCWRKILILKSEVVPKDNYEIEGREWSVPVICGERGLVNFRVNMLLGIPEVRCTCKLCTKPEDND